MAKSLVKWTLRQVELAKASAKTELDVVGAEAGEKARLHHALARIRELEDDVTGPGRLQSLVFVMSALVQHQRRPSLSPAQVDALVQRAFAILQTQRIKPGVSALSFLYGELHQVRSLIYRRDGDSWRSAWEQQTAEAVRPSGEPPQGFDALALGNRALRKGHAALAFMKFGEALTLPLNEENRQLAQIGRVRSLRLSGRLDEALAASKNALNLPEISARTRLELEWESLTAHAALTGDQLPILTATRRGGPHYLTTYLIDAFLGFAALQNKEALARISKMRTIARHAELAPRQQGLAFDAALVIEECYDTEIPLALRLKRLGDILAEAPKLLSIDKELLLWAAATRWLVRIRSFRLALLALKEYESLSLRLSGGTTPDVLRTAGDLVAAPWYAEGRWQTAP
jgi:hypothetical protein